MKSSVCSQLQSFLSSPIMCVFLMSCIMFEIIILTHVCWFCSTDNPFTFLFLLVGWLVGFVNFGLYLGFLNSLLCTLWLLYDWLALGLETKEALPCSWSSLPYMVLIPPFTCMLVFGVLCTALKDPSVATPHKERFQFSCAWVPFWGPLDNITGLGSPPCPMASQSQNCYWERQFSFKPCAPRDSKIPTCLSPLICEIGLISSPSHVSPLLPIWSVIKCQFCNLLFIIVLIVI